MTDPTFVDFTSDPTFVDYMAEIHQQARDWYEPVPSTTVTEATKGLMDAMLAAASASSRGGASAVLPIQLTAATGWCAPAEVHFQLDPGPRG